VSNIVPIVVD